MKIKGKLKTHFNIYIYIKELYCMWPLWTSKNHTYFHADMLRNCIPSSVYVCLTDKCWKFSIYYKFTIKELLKLTKGITWRHSNIVLKLEKIKFTNTLKNNVQLEEEINGTKGTKQIQNNKTLNIKRFAYHNSQTGVDDAARIKKICPPPTVA